MNFLRIFWELLFFMLKKKKYLKRMFYFKLETYFWFPHYFALWPWIMSSMKPSYHLENIENKLMCIFFPFFHYWRNICMQWNIAGSWGKFVTHLWVSLLSRIMYYVTCRQSSKTIGPHIFSSFIVFICKKNKPIISYLIMTVEEKPFEIKKTFSTKCQLIIM